MWFQNHLFCFAPLSLILVLPFRNFKKKVKIFIVRALRPWFVSVRGVGIVWFLRWYRAFTTVFEGKRMPELPEVETVVKALRKALRGRTLNGARFLGNMRLPFNAGAVTRAVAGKRVTGVRRRAKYIVIDLEDSLSLLSHLGMTGFFHLESGDSAYHNHDRAAFILADGEELRYADARRFGFVKLARLSRMGGWPDELAGLGVEPLCRAFNGRALFEKAHGRKTPVKVFIMDQAIVVGVGNIYASESLFAAGIDPTRYAGDLTEEEWELLSVKIQAVLRDAIRQGGSTIKNYRTVDGSEGGFQRSLMIYGKNGGVCPICSGGVVTIRQGGRSTFYCPNCQR